jgi:hypothetical protein
LRLPAVRHSAEPSQPPSEWFWLASIGQACITPLDERVTKLHGLADSKSVAYFRVFIARQRKSGFGDWLDGVSWQIIASFTEVPSGKGDANRPKLAKSLRMCRGVFGKLDRLSRDAAWAAGDEDERSAISNSTKDALAQAKACRVKLGNPANLSRREVGSADRNAAKAASRSRKPLPSKNVSARPIALSLDAMVSLRLNWGATLPLVPPRAILGLAPGEGTKGGDQGRGWE